MTLTVKYIRKSGKPGPTSLRNWEEITLPSWEEIDRFISSPAILHASVNGTRLK